VYRLFALNFESWSMSCPTLITKRSGRVFGFHRRTLKIIKLSSKLSKGRALVAFKIFLSLSYDHSLGGHVKNSFHEGLVAFTENAIISRL
jgi:hypothetical protein